MSAPTYLGTLAATVSHADAVALAMPDAAATWRLPRPYVEQLVDAAKLLAAVAHLALDHQIQQDADLAALARRDDDCYDGLAVIREEVEDSILRDMADQREAWAAIRRGYDADADLADDWDELAYAREERER